MHGYGFSFCYLIHDFLPEISGRVYHLSGEQRRIIHYFIPNEANIIYRSVLFGGILHPG